MTRLQILVFDLLDDKKKVFAHNGHIGSITNFNIFYQKHCEWESKHQCKGTFTHQLLLELALLVCENQNLWSTLYLVLCPLDGRDIHVVGGGAHIFILFVGEDVNTNQVNLQYNNLNYYKQIKLHFWTFNLLIFVHKWYFRTNQQLTFLDVFVQKKETHVDYTINRWLHFVCFSPKMWIGLIMITLLPLLQYTKTAQRTIAIRPAWKLSACDYNYTCKWSGSW